MSWNTFDVGPVSGNLTADADARYTQEGKPVVSFRLASTTGSDRQSGEKYTIFTRVSYWGKDGPELANRLKKGTPVVLAGRLENRPWTDNSGAKRDGLELTARSIEFVAKAGQAPQETNPFDDAGDLVPF